MKRNILALYALAVLMLAVIFYYSRQSRLIEMPTLVINLDHRRDRYDALKANMQRTGWILPAERVAAVKASPGWKGCAASHIKCVRLAKERNYPYVLILEDDCMFHQDSLRDFQRILPTLMKRHREWDIFLGGVTQIKKASMVQQHPAIYEVKAYPTHFCLLNATAYDKILEAYDDTEIDYFYQMHLRQWTTLPYIATQRPDKSDIINKTADYTKYFQDSATILRGLTVGSVYVRPSKK
jgi:GR25 family glycosyltransferase involved in LPS biosynthesis